MSDTKSKRLVCWVELARLDPSDDLCHLVVRLAPSARERIDGVVCIHTLWMLAGHDKPRWEGWLTVQLEGGNALDLEVSRPWRDGDYLGCIVPWTAPNGWRLAGAIGTLTIDDRLSFLCNLDQLADPRDPNSRIVIRLYDAQVLSDDIIVSN